MCCLIFCWCLFPIKVIIQKKQCSLTCTYEVNLSHSNSLFGKCFVFPFCVLYRWRQWVILIIENYELTYSHIYLGLDLYMSIAWNEYINRSDSRTGTEDISYKSYANCQFVSWVSRLCCIFYSEWVFSTLFWFVHFVLWRNF